MTHAWPREEALLSNMRKDPPNESLLIYGTETEPQHYIELFLGARGVLRIVRANTGSEPFGVLYHVPSQIISVIRRSPTLSAIQYQCIKTNI